MTKIESLDDAVNLHILTLEEIAIASGKYKVYQRWFQEEEKLIVSGRSTSLPEYLLIEYHIEHRSTPNLAAEFGVSAPTMKSLLVRLGIPIKNYSEANKGRVFSAVWRRKISEARSGEKNPNYGKPLSEETRKKISKSNTGKVRSEEARNHLSRYWKGKMRGPDNPNFGNHLSEEAKKRISEARTGKSLTAMHRKAISQGLMKLPAEVRRKSAEAHRKNSYYVQERFYASSQQEGAVALLLKKYIPAYEIIEGQTFQVSDNGINNGGLDFLVGDLFIEWHPIALYSNTLRRGDIPKEEFDSYKKIKEQLEDLERRRFQKEYKNVIAVNYRNSRQQAVDNSGYSGCEVIHVENVKELYSIIGKLGVDTPLIDFSREFKNMVNYVKGFKVLKENN